MATKNPRISFVPSDRTLATLRTINSLSGKSMASVVSEMMDEMSPIFDEMIEALRKINQQPEKVREAIEQLANFARTEIAQAVDQVNRELPLPMQDHRGKHRGERVRRAAGT